MSEESDLYVRALKFATGKHSGQVRKWTGAEYMQHPVAVSHILRKHSAPELLRVVALLHDTLEDTNTTYVELVENFGAEVADLVQDLTDVSRPEDGNRATRKRMDLEHSMKADVRAQSVKLADLLENAADIVVSNQKFAPVFLQEAEALLSVLRCASIPSLWEELSTFLAQCGSMR